MDNKYYITWDEIYSKIREKTSLLAQTLPNSKLPIKIYGIPRGGAIIVGLLYQQNTNWIEIVDDPKDADVILDDLIDSGRTKSKYMILAPGKPFIFLYDKQNDEDIKGKWLIFPYENTAEKDIEDSVVRILEYFGEDAKEWNLQLLLEKWNEYIHDYEVLNAR